MVAAISSVLPETKAGNSTPPLLQPEEINGDYNRNRNHNNRNQNNNNNQRRPRAREVASRYMSMSPSSTNSISSSTSSTSSSSRNSFSGTTSGGCGGGGGVGRSKSTPRRPKPTHLVANDAEMSGASKSLVTSSRSFSVSFQGGSFSVPISRTQGERNVSPESRRGKVDGGGARNATIDRRRSTPLRGKNTTPERRRSAPLRGEVDGGRGRGGGGNPKVGGDQMRWPAISRQSCTILRSLECSNNECKDYVRPRALNDSLFDDNDSVDGLSVPSDSESISSGSSGARETNGGPLGRGGGGGGVVASSNFWQETNMRLRRLRDPRLGLSSSPSLKFVSPMKGLNPSHVRSSVGGLMCCSPWEAPSVLSFAVDVRRANVGENRISDAHQLRLLYNRHLQWRFVAARADAVLSVQRRNAEKNIWNAWITITGRRDSVRNKRIQLQLLRQKLKLMSVLREQIAYLMEWSHLDECHSCSLQGTIESLKASTLRLPVIGVTADVEKLKEALSSAVDVMLSIASSTCFLHMKVEEVKSLTTEISGVAAKERISMEKCVQVLALLTAMQVKDCSLRTHMLQLNRLPLA